MNRRIFLLLAIVWLGSCITGGMVYAQAVLEKGKPAPDISLPAPDGNLLALSSLKGKLVLIDFWASWCGPCRSANRALQPVYKKYRDKGFEVFSVSVDNNAEAWKKAIKTDRIAWKQVHDPGGWDAPVALQWGIEELPTTYLVDPQGVLLAKNPTHEQLETFIKLFLE